MMGLLLYNISIKKKKIHAQATLGTFKCGLQLVINPQIQFLPGLRQSMQIQNWTRISHKNPQVNPLDTRILPWEYGHDDKWSHV